MSDERLRRGEQTRNNIIQAAHDLFIRQGYHGTSMRQIAKKTGIALGGLYNHFDSKEDVFQAVFLEYHPYQEVIPVILQTQGETIEQFVYDAIYRMKTALEGRPNFMNLMFIEVVEFKNVHTHRLFSQLLPQLQTLIQHITEDNRGRLHPIPSLMLLRAFWGLFFSYYLTESIFAENAPPEFRQGALDYMIEIFLHGVLKE